MTRTEALSRLIKGIQADLGDYGRLRHALDAQFAAALDHDTRQLAVVADEILVLVGLLDERLKERMSIINKLSVPASKRPIEAICAIIPAASQPALNRVWEELEKLSGECKSLNLRNCRLLTDQHEIMQRVLQAEEPFYAPV